VGAEAAEAAEAEEEEEEEEGEMQQETQQEETEEKTEEETEKSKTMTDDAAAAKSKASPVATAAVQDSPFWQSWVPPQLTKGATVIQSRARGMIQRKKDKIHGIVQVVFSEGRMGIELESRDRKYGAQIYRFTRHHSTGDVMPAERSCLLEIGMVVLRVNDEIVVDCYFSETLEKIKKVERPVTITFAHVQSKALRKADFKYGPRSVRVTNQLRRAVEDEKRRECQKNVLHGDVKWESFLWLGHDSFKRKDFRHSVEWFKYALRKRMANATEQKVRGNAGVDKGERNTEEKDSSNLDMGARFWRELAQGLLLWWRSKDNDVGCMNDMTECQKCFEVALGYQENSSDPQVWHDVSEVYLRHGSVHGTAKVLTHVLESFPEYEYRTLVIWKASMAFRHLNMHDHSLEYSTFLLKEYAKLAPEKRKRFEIGVNGMTTLDVAFQVARTLHLIGPTRKTETAQAYQRCHTLQQRMVATGHAVAAYGGGDDKGDDDDRGGRRPPSAPTTFGDARGGMPFESMSSIDDEDRPTTSQSHLSGGHSLSSGTRSMTSSIFSSSTLRKKKSVAYERAHVLIGWLHDPRTWLDRARSMVRQRFWLPALDLCRQALKRLKSWDGLGDQECVPARGNQMTLEERKRGMRQEAEWMLAVSLYSLNNLEEACEHGGNVLLLGTTDLNMTLRIKQWSSEKGESEEERKRTLEMKKGAAAKEEEKEREMKEMEKKRKKKGTRRKSRQGRFQTKTNEKNQKLEEEEQSVPPVYEMTEEQQQAAVKLQAVTRRRQSRFVVNRKRNQNATGEMSTLPESFPLKERPGSSETQNSSRPTTTGEVEEDEMDEEDEEDEEDERENERVEMEEGEEEVGKEEETTPRPPSRPPTPPRPRTPKTPTTASRYIQNMYRMRDARRRVEDKRNQKRIEIDMKNLEIAKKGAATRLQAHARRRRDAQKVSYARAVKLEKDQQNAAVRMQGLFRSKTARQKVNRIKAKNAYKDLQKRRKKKLELHLLNQRQLSPIPSPQTSPMFGIRKSPTFQRTSSFQFASPKKQQMIDKWHDKLKRCLVQSNGQTLTVTGTTITSVQMQTLVAAVVEHCDVFPEEACCALVDSKHRKHMSRYVSSMSRTSHLLKSHEIERIVVDVAERIGEPEYFNEIRTVCDILDVKKYAKGNGSGRHLHPWCSSNKEEYDITIDQVIAAGDIAAPDFIQWASDGNEHNLVEEQELLGELRQEGLSNRMKGFIMQEVMSHRLASGRGVAEAPSPTKKMSSTSSRPAQSLSHMINQSMERSEAEHVKQWQRYKVCLFCGHFFFFLVEIALLFNLTLIFFFSFSFSFSFSFPFPFSFSFSFSFSYSFSFSFSFSSFFSFSFSFSSFVCSI